MPFGVILLLIDVGLIVHAAKTGRFWPWGYVILFIPGFGALAYVLVELLPEWFGSAQGQHARRRVVSTLDPEKRYRALTDQLGRYGRFVGKHGQGSVHLPLPYGEREVTPPA